LPPSSGQKSMFDLYLLDSTASHAAIRQFLKSALNTVESRDSSRSVRRHSCPMLAYLLLLDLVKFSKTFRYFYVGVELGTVLHVLLICIMVCQCSETNVMHFLYNSLRFKYLGMFRALLVHPQKEQHKRHLVHCVCVMSVGCTRIRVYGSHRIISTRIHTHTHTPGRTPLNE
jgi:hypothetical protein